jgi:hypothetical protein
VTCPHCATNSAVYDLTKQCCAVRFLMMWPGDKSSTAEELCRKYGHKIEELRAEAKRRRG